MRLLLYLNLGYRRSRRLGLPCLAEVASWCAAVHRGAMQQDCGLGSVTCESPAGVRSAVVRRGAMQQDSGLGPVTCESPAGLRSAAVRRVAVQQERWAERCKASGGPSCLPAFAHSLASGNTHTWTAVILYSTSDRYLFRSGTEV